MNARPLRTSTRLALTAALLRIEAQLAKTVSRETIRDVLDLIERAEYDLAQNWPGAAIDALTRACRLLPEPATRGETP